MPPRLTSCAAALCAFSCSVFLAAPARAAKAAVKKAAGPPASAAAPDGGAQAASPSPPSNDPAAKAGAAAGADGGSAQEAPPGPGDEQQGRALAALVQRYYARAKDFSAKFAQTYTYAALGRSKQSTGKVLVKKPGLLRWEYETPDKKLLLLDGKAFWQYVPEDNQVMVNRHFEGTELSSAFTFLWGKGELTREFAARALPLPESLRGVPGAQKQALELLPKRPSAQLQRVVFAVDDKGAVVASVVTDGQGNENRLVFSDERTDSQLADGLFRFEVPKGANVQELR